MRPLPLYLLVLALLGCSKAAVRPVTPPTVLLSPVVPTAAVASPSRDARAPASPPSVHVVRLPDRPESDPAASSTIGLAPGDVPGPEFPAGTVYVVTKDTWTQDPMRVMEWDLARSAMVRSITLPIPADEYLPWILRVGDELRLVASGLETVSYVQLTRDLRVERSEEWAGRVYPPRIEAFSADARLSAMAYSGNAATVSGGDDGVLLTTFDATGKRVARRIVQRPDPGDTAVDVLDSSAVVIDGRVFFLRCSDRTGVELLALSPDLRIEKRVQVSNRNDGMMDLHARGGRLQVDDGYPERRAIEFSTDLELLGPTTPVPDPPGLKLGEQTVGVCVFSSLAWLAWGTAIADPCASIPESLWSASAQDGPYHAPERH